MKKSMIFLLVIVCSAFVFFSTEVNAQTMTFKDVDPNVWYYSDLELLVTEGVLNGVSETEFAPDRAITRAEFIKIISFIADADFSGLSGKTDFTDVSVDAWYAKNVQWAYENDIIIGKTATLFAPNENISREEAAVILYRYDQLFNNMKASSAIVSFVDDSDISEWAKDAVYFLQKNNVIQGYNGKYFPKDKLLRCEATSFFANYLDKMSKIVGKDGSMDILSGDIITYKQDLITNEDVLYELANSEIRSSSDCVSEFECDAFLTKISEGISLSSDNTNTLPVADYTQHYMTVQREDGTIEDFYVTDCFVDMEILDAETDNISPSSYVESEHIIVTPGNGTYDSTRSATAWAKICYVIGRTGNTNISPQYVQAIYFKGTVRQVDSTVKVSNRRLWYRNKGTCAFSTGSQNITNGPLYASAGSETILKYAPSNFVALEYNYHEIVCTCQADLSRGTSSWGLSTTISKTNYQ